MTKYEKKLVSMLNYYEVDIAKTKKDEKMTDKDLNRFLDRLNQRLDYYMLEDIIRRIKEGNKGNPDNPKSDETGADNTNSLESFDNMDDEKDFSIDKPEEPKDIDKPEESKDKTPDETYEDGILTDINNLLQWLTFILFTGEYTVVVNDDGKTIHIQLVRLNKGKK